MTQQLPDFFADPTVVVDPFPYYERARAQGPVWQEPRHGCFVVTGYDEIAAIYRDPDTFSSCNSFGGPFPGLPEQPTGDDASDLIEKYRDIFPSSELMVTFDPPRHTDHRGLMMRLLTPKRLEENAAFTRQLADQLIDGFADSGHCEFINDYANQLAMLVIADLLGVPADDQTRLRQSMVSRGVAGVIGEGAHQGNFLAHLEEFFTGYVEDRRCTPRDDVIGKLSAATFKDGSVPTVTDVVRVAMFLFAGGQGTAARYLGNAMLIVAEDPDLQDRLRGEPQRIPAFVEEALRFESPVKSNFRMARRRTTVAGVDIPAGSALMLLLPAADRDPRRFEQPDVFDAGRPNAREHVAFGRGVHSCPGAPLVRHEGRITLERMLARFDSIRISTDHHGPPEARHFDYTPTYILRGVEALHLDLRPRT